MLHTVNDPQRFSAADFSILHFLHHPIEQCVERVRRIRLRYCRAAPGVTCLADSRCSTERPAASAVRARSEGAHPVIKGGQRFLNVEIRSPRGRHAVVAAYNWSFEVARDHRKKVARTRRKP